MIQFGYLAKECGMELPLQVLRSSGGFYLGTQEDGCPCTRESVEYFPNKEAADNAMSSGRWTQRRSL